MRRGTILYWCGHILANVTVLAIVIGAWMLLELPMPAIIHYTCG